MNTFDKFVGTIIIAALLVMIVGMVLILSQSLLTDKSDYTTIETECYDRFNHEIKEVICEKEIYPGVRK